MLCCADYIEAFPLYLGMFWVWGLDFEEIVNSSLKETKLKYDLANFWKQDCNH